MKEQIFNNRYCWIYLNWDYQKQQGSIATFVSPDRNGKHLDTIDTPYQYQLTRNNLRYNIQSEVQLSEYKASQIAGELYEAEFVLAPKWRMKMAKGK